MILKSLIKDYFFETAGINRILIHLEEIKKNQESINERITGIETKLTDLTRAVATLALVQANLFREISDIAERETRSRTKSSPARKIGDDFTN